MYTSSPAVNLHITRLYIRSQADAGSEGTGVPTRPLMLADDWHFQLPVMRKILQIKKFLDCLHGYISESK